MDFQVHISLLVNGILSNLHPFVCSSRRYAPTGAKCSSREADCRYLTAHDPSRIPCCSWHQLGQAPRAPRRRFHRKAWPERDIITRTYMSLLRIPLTGQRFNRTTAWQNSEIMHKVSDIVGGNHRSPGTRVSSGGVGLRYAKLEQLTIKKTGIPRCRGIRTRAKHGPYSLSDNCLCLICQSGMSLLRGVCALSRRSLLRPRGSLHGSLDEEMAKARGTGVFTFV